MKNATDTDSRSKGAPYWGAMLVISLRDGDRVRAEEARQALEQLGIRVTIPRSRDRREPAHA